MNQGGTSTLISRNKTNCQGYSRSEYQAGMFDGEGATSVKHKAQPCTQFINVLQT